MYLTQPTILTFEIMQKKGKVAALNPSKMDSRPVSLDKIHTRFYRKVQDTFRQSAQ